MPMELFFRLKQALLECDDGDGNGGVDGDDDEDDPRKDGFSCLHVNTIRLLFAFKMPGHRTGFTKPYKRKKVVENENEKGLRIGISIQREKDADTCFFTRGESSVSSL